MIVNFFDEAVVKGCSKGRLYDFTGICGKTLKRWKNNDCIDKRKGSAKRVHIKLSEDEIEQIKKIACDKQFRDLSPYHIVPALLDEGRYIASVSTFYRVLNAEGLLKYRGRVKRKGHSMSVKEAIFATAPGQLWSWDITYLKTEVAGKYYYLYLFIDVWSRLIVGWEVYEEENGENSIKLIDKMGLSDGTLHSDNGGPMRYNGLRERLKESKIAVSFSRPNNSNDNAYSESLFKTMKYSIGYPGTFKTLEQSREWVKKFVRWYNLEHKHSSIGYVTPAERHTGIDKYVFDNRNIILEEAYAANPSRWTRKPKLYVHQEIVILKKGSYVKKEDAK